MAIHEFNPTIYPRKLWVVKGVDSEFIKGKFCHRNGEDLDLFDDDDNPPVCSTFKNIQEKHSGDFGVLVYIYGQMNVGHISHEAYHVASDIFRDIGAEHDIDNQEPAAYLIGWCAKCIAAVNEYTPSMVCTSK